MVSVFLLLCTGLPSVAQDAPYNVFPDAEPPYFRVRYEPSENAGELKFAVNYTVWIPEGVRRLRGVIVHQHGCGTGSCRSGLTGAYDLHWQALAQKHDCALLAPAYEQPEQADCQQWCDPRNGSDVTFQRCLRDLGMASDHSELATVPWALWGHSGGGHWAGGMVLLHPDRVAAAWLRSGVPLLKENPDRPAIRAHTVPPAALQVPIMCNLGTREGVSVTDGRFAGVWPAVDAFFSEVRSSEGLIGVAVDPLTSHECGNQRYLAIPWLDACLSERLPAQAGHPMKPMPTSECWLAPPTGTTAMPVEQCSEDPLKAAWLPNAKIAAAWMQYVSDTEVEDTTPPPAPFDVEIINGVLTWNATADVESGLAGFQILRNGESIATVPENAMNRFGRPLFQNLQYSDTPTQPLVRMRYTVDHNSSAGDVRYQVVSVNTAGLKSPPSERARAR